MMKRSTHEVVKALALGQLRIAGISYGGDTRIEAYDFGLGDYDKEGLAIVPRVNEPEYSSRWIILRPGQEAPLQYHERTLKTLFVINGQVRLWVDGQTIMLIPGESYTISPGVVHAFNSIGGVVMEEVSTHCDPADWFFKNASITTELQIEED